MTKVFQNSSSVRHPEDIVPGATLELEIQALAMGGMGVGRAAGLVVFVEQALPGQRVEVLVTQRKKRHAEAMLVQVVRAVPEQVAPRCPHFGVCGGCTWQHMDYQAQLDWKRKLTAEALQRLGGAQDVVVAPTRPSPEQWGYRNKMEFAFSGQGEGLLLGLRKRASHEVLDLETCHLISAGAVEVLHVVQELCAATGLPAWDAQTRDGYWRYLVVRCFADALLAQLITADAPQWDEMTLDVTRQLIERVPSLAGVVHGVRRRPEQLALAENTVHVTGREALDVTLYDAMHAGDAQSGFTYRVSAGSFFQTNTKAAQELFSLVRQWAAATADEVVWDVYCGVGGAGLFVARDARLLVGFDISREAVADAQRNATANGLANCLFRAGEVRRLLPRERERPDIVLLDPPRAGLRPETVSYLVDMKPRRVIYISCNPATQARDIGHMLEQYRLAAVQPFDLFPHSHHVESVALLERR